MNSIHRQKGQSMTEYMVIGAALAFFLFAATPVGTQLTQAMRDFYASLTFFLSLP
jgi:hypothetical protein